MDRAPELAASSHKSSAAVIRVAMSIGLLELEGRYPEGEGEE